MICHSAENACKNHKIVYFYNFIEYIVSSSRKKLPLGAILQQAGLVSADNVKEALREQREDKRDRRIGEILASQGHINSHTADFFADSLPILIEETPKRPLGQYLKQARLLSEDQVESILEQQQQTQLKFGEQAVKNGFIKQTTLNFFLKCLAQKSKTELNQTEEEQDVTKIYSEQQIKNSFYKIKLKLLNLEDRNDYYKIVLERILFWTQGQSFLTQILFKLMTSNQNKITVGKEAEYVDFLIKTKIVKNWRNQIAGKHLQLLETRLLNNSQCQPTKLLQLYRRVLTTRAVVSNDSREQQELIKIGIIVKQQSNLAVANRIYASVFNLRWLEEKLQKNYGRHQNDISYKSTTVSSAPPKSKKMRSLQSMLLIIALGSLLLVFLGSLYKRIQVRQSFQKGNQLLQNKSFERAIAEYNNILNIDSNYFQAWTNRGYALAGLEKYEEMRQSCSTATIINPDAVYALNCQGEALHNLNRATEAITFFDQAITLDEKDPIFLINKSESLESSGKEAESLATIYKAIDILEQTEKTQGQRKVSNEFAIALTFLGNSYRKKEKYQSALLNYDRALEYAPNYFPAQIGKGVIFNRLKRHSEAQKEFEKILDNKQLSAEKQAQTWFYLGKTFCKSKQDAKGIAAFEQAINLDADYQAAIQAKENC